MLIKHSARVLNGNKSQAMEGVSKTMNAIIEFPSEEAVNNFYNDPAYQAFINIRHRSTSNCTMKILNEFERK